MEPQPSTSTAGAAKAGASDCGSSDGIVPSTYGGPAHVPSPQQQEHELFFINVRASNRQLQQLFGSTCRLRLQRCQLPPIIQTGNSESAATPSAEERPADSTTVAKVEESGSDSSSDDDQVKMLPAPSAAVPLAKKKGGPRVSQRKSPACCHVCKKTVHLKGYLRLHMRKHSGTKRYSCGTCGRSFWNPSAFAYHKKAKDQRNGVCPKTYGTGGWRHKGAWTCKICGKRMKNGGSYNDHMKRHRGDKRFKCGDCGKAFVISSDLAEHRKIHSGVWQFSCVFCERGFHFQNNLFNHLRSHTEEMPYFCVVDGCGKSYRHPDSLKKHWRLIHLKTY